MNVYQPCLYTTSIDRHDWPYLSAHNLIVGIEADSTDEQEVFCEALHRQVNTTGDMLIVCPDSMVDRIHDLVQDYVNKCRPVMWTILRSPDEFPAYHPRYEW